MFGPLTALLIPVRWALMVWPRTDRERGDIPGWVMIAIMSAAVVVALIPLVGPVIGHAFTNAVNAVSNTGSSSGG